VVEAIACIERDGDLKFRAPDPMSGPDSFFNLRVPGGVVIEYTLVDGGSAFDVTRVRRFMMG
jgi:hypothetical protein